MKKTTFTATALLFGATLAAQSYTTGTLALDANNGTPLDYSAKIDVDASTVQLTLIGPSTSWLGIGFDNTSMAESGDVLIFNGTSMTDRHFAGFGTTPTMDAQQDWTVTSNTQAGGVRTVVATRARDTGDADDYVFTASAQSLNIVYARRQGSTTIGYHGANSCGQMMTNLTLGAEKFEVDSFKLFPNPASGSVTVELPSGIASGTVKIYDNLGRVVKNQAVTATEGTIQTNGLLTGSYLVVLRTDYGNATKTLLVE
ncbi:T9SS type A sorting domain-containing protein [Flavobacterium caeni]|uniref:Por secretion system C-terminal sorting domain-containing protein n=1 Tax=Flavobacterium caeni TaxID=490189 RepID=A0A1G5EPG6_9FLAO|nr:T9SS type A sorting domain-containing protein [Flavobacterium caeni]SCY28328.1 Por secretion system C-terminal sorting domain-containing protein [Flavobacterium caeni]